MINRNKIMIHAVVCGCVWIQASVASADHPRPVERFGRWSGSGWGDGYHACESSGLRIAADLPPRTFSSTFGHSAKQCGNKACGQGGCSGCRTTFYDRFDAANAAMCDQTSCDGVGCDGVYGFQATHGESLLTATGDHSAVVPTPPELNEMPVSEAHSTSGVTSTPSRIASNQPSPTSQQTLVLPVNVQPSRTPDATSFHLLDRGTVTTLAASRVPTMTTVEKKEAKLSATLPDASSPSVTNAVERRPTRLPSVDVATRPVANQTQAPQPSAPMPVKVGSQSSSGYDSMGDFGQPAVKLNPFAR